MQAIQIRRYGSSEVLEQAELPTPNPGPRQLLVQNAASSVNPVDWKIRSGALRLFNRLRLPAVLGADFCGRVKAVGEQVSDFQVGDWVYGFQPLKQLGAYAEYLVADEPVVSRKPMRLDAPEAAAVPLAALTALRALRDLGVLEPEQRVLVIGASGGVGHFAVQIAKALGAEVSAVCGTDNVHWVGKLGADRIFDYRRESYKGERSRYDLVFDAVAADSYRKIAPLLSASGAYVTTLPGPGSVFAAAATLLSGKRAHTVFVQPRGSDLDTLSRWIEQGDLIPQVDRRYPLHETAAAHDYSETRRAKGKIVIEIP